MSVIADNKTLLVHVVAEVVAIGGMYYILSRQINSLRSELGVVAHRVREQQEQMTEHAQAISILFDKLKKQDLPMPAIPPAVRKAPRKPQKASNKQQTSSEVRTESARREQEDIANRMLMKQMAHQESQAKLLSQQIEPVEEVSDYDYTQELAEDLSELEEIEDVEDLKKE